MDLVPKKKNEDKTTPTKRKGPTKTDGEPLTGMVMYNGAMLDIDSVIQRLEKSETSDVEMEKKLDNMNEEKGNYEGCSRSSWNLVIKCSNIDILNSYFEISQVDIVELAPHT